MSPTATASAAPSTGNGGDSRTTSPTVRSDATMTFASSAPSTTPTTDADRADDRGLGEDEAADLAAGRARRAQQSDLADALVDGHRQRVEDQERAGEQGDGGDEGGRGGETGRGGAQRVGEILRRGDDVGLGEERRLEGGRDRGGIGTGIEGDVDAGHAGLIERLLGRVSGTITVRPSAPPSGPSPATIPATTKRVGAPAPRIVSDEPTVRPLALGQPFRDERAGPRSGVAVPHRVPGDDRHVVDLAVLDRVDPEDRHGRWQAAGRGGGAEVGPSFQRGRRDGHARSVRDGRDRLGTEPGLAERGDA